MKKITQISLLAISTLASASALACASCGCSLNTDYGTQGMGNSEGWTFDIRYDSLNQNQLRSGTGTISPAAASTTQSPNGPAEVEGYTNNRYLTVGLDYNNGDTWGVQVSIPYISRDHMTFGSDPGGWPSGAAGYTSQGSGIGDVKVIGRYFGWADERNWGVQFGFKLPTGRRDQIGNAPDGSTAAVDPGLQLGSGTTDVILGVYKFDHLNGTENWGYFASAQFQHALNSSNVPSVLIAINSNYGTTYKPGDSMNASLGLNYHGLENWTTTLQLNYMNKRTDGGSAGDTFSTGGQLLYLTPGAIFKWTEQASVYTNLQLPVYQNLNGIQLAPKYVASVGLRYHF